MNPPLVIGIIAGYFLLLIVIARWTSKGADTQTFYCQPTKPLVFSGFWHDWRLFIRVTFISVPGEVGNGFFSYFQVVIGYLLGYFVIATVLLPLYYKLQLVSIYTYLESRFGFWSYKTGAAFFLSFQRVVGASFRLFGGSGIANGFVQCLWYSVLGICANDHFTHLGLYLQGRH